MPDAPVDGVLIQGKNGEYYFIAAKDLEIYRLTDKEAARTKELVGPEGLQGAAKRDDQHSRRIDHESRGSPRRRLRHHRR